MVYGYKEVPYAEGVWITVSRIEHKDDYPQQEVTVLAAKKPGPLARLLGVTFEKRLAAARRKADRLCRLYEQLDEEHAARVRDTRQRVAALERKIEKVNAGEKNYIIVEGDLLESDATYIAHQTNCTSTGAAGGVAKAIFKRFPESDSYTERRGKKPPMKGQMPGDVEVRGRIMNLYAQFHGGGMAEDPNEIDQPGMRAWWFSQCLEKIAAMGFPQGTSIALPYNIGCGIAGGNWESTYEPMLDGFAQRMRRRGVEIRLHRLPQ